MRLLLERGRVRRGRRRVYTAQALAGYAVGLPAFSATRIAAQTFYALGDTRTPVIVGFVSVAANVVFALSLMWPLEHIGLALASSLSSYVNLARALLAAAPPARRARRGRRSSRSLARTLVRVRRARALVRLGRGPRSGGGAARRTIAALGLGGVIVYAAIAAAIRAPEIARSARDAARGAGGPCPSARRR